MRHVFLLATLVFAVVENAAQADMILHFGQGGTTAGIASTFSATAGSQVTLDVWLSQTGTYPIPPFFSAGDYRLSNDPALTMRAGLGLGQYVFDVSSSSGAVTPASIGDVTYGAGFLADPALIQPGGGTLRVAAFATSDLASGTLTPVYVPEAYQGVATANPGALATNSILLGQVKFDIDPGASGNVAFSAVSPYDANDLNLSLLPFGLGANLTAPEVIVIPTAAGATLMVNAVPEPNALAIVALLICGGLQMRPRRLRVNR